MRIEFEGENIVAKYIAGDGESREEVVPIADVVGHRRGVVRRLRMGESENIELDQAFARFYQGEQAASGHAFERAQETRNQMTIESLRAQGLRKQRYDSQNDTSGNSKPYSQGL